MLALRFGLIDGRRYTFSEVGARYGVSRERVRQIEVKALSELRTLAQRLELRAYLT